VSLAEHYARLVAPPFVLPRLVVIMQDGYVGWLLTDMACERLWEKTGKKAVNDLELQQMWEYELQVPSWLVGDP
jgi:hypothetical protein